MLILNLPTPLGNNAKSVLCPECKKQAKPLGKISVIDRETGLEGKEDGFACTTCEQKVPYPGNPDGSYSDWTLEFCLKPDGTVMYLRPSAEWFS